MANTHENLEHAEHAEHNAHDPFNQRVAVSMAIVAAILAGISMVGHRTHNMVLQLQGDANRYRTEAATAEVEKSNLFAWYQAKKLRQSQLESSANQMELVPAIEPPRKPPESEADKKAEDEWKKKVKDRADARAKAVADARKKAADYEKSNKGEPLKDPEGDNLPDLQRRGNEAGKRSEVAKEKARTTREEAEHIHHQANRFDIAHLSSELGLVLCSIALLTKKKGFWFAGLAAAVIALGLTISAYTIPHEGSESHEVPSQTAPDDKGKPH